MQTKRTRAIAGASVLLMVAGVTLTATSAVSAAQGEKVTICHRTNSVTNPYTVNTVAVSSIDGSKKNDHTQHVGPIFDFSNPDKYEPPFNGDEWGDIIPPTENDADGQNWTEVAYEGGPTGQEIFDAGCRAPEAEPDPVAGLTIVKVVDGVDAPAIWTFDFDSTELGGFALTDADDTNEFDGLEPGDYTVTETEQDDYTLAVDWGEDATVSDVEGGVSVTLAADDDVTCTFTNTYEAPEEPVVPEEPEEEVLPNETPGPVVENNQVTRAQPAPAVQAEVTFAG